MEGNMLLLLEVSGEISLLQVQQCSISVLERDSCVCQRLSPEDIMASNCICRATGSNNAGSIVAPPDELPMIIHSVPTHNYLWIFPVAFLSQQGVDRIKKGNALSDCSLDCFAPQCPGDLILQESTTNPASKPAALAISCSSIW